jgi:hypothetical protein
VLTALTAATAVAAVAVTAIAVVDGRDEQIVLDVSPAVAAETPVTAPPRTDPSPADGPGATVPTTGGPADPDARSGRDAAAPDHRHRSDPDDGPTDKTPATLATPSLADQLGPRGSAIPPPVAPRAMPIGLQISSIDVSRYPVRAIGLEPDGQLEIPDETEIGWYRYGAAPGHPGATVLAAHVSWNRTTGPFARLGSIEPGDQVEVALDDGTIRHYEVVERAIYGKLELPHERLWTNTGPEKLVLITCGGAYNPDLRRYAENIVTYAVPIG